MTYSAAKQIVIIWTTPIFLHSVIHVIYVSYHIICTVFHIILAATYIMCDTVRDSRIRIINAIPIM